MALGHGSEIVTNNLLLSLDFANSKNYDSRENLFTYSELFTNAAWSVSELTVSATTGVTSPINSAVFTLTESSTTSVQHTFAQSPNPSIVGEIYTFSVYLKAGTRTQVSLTGWGEGYAAFNLSTGTVIQTGGHICSIVSVGNGWYRCSITVTKTQTTNYFYIIPWNGSHVYTGNGSYFYATGAMVAKNPYINPYVATTSSPVTKSTTATSTAASLTHTLYNTANGYINYSNSAVTFTRAANTSPNPKLGGVIQTTGTGNLTLQNFMYNDHTWEVWFRIDDINPGAYDGTEWSSVLACYSGWHQGFIYNASTMWYYTLNAPNPDWYSCTWTVGTSGAQINQGSWYQIAVTKNGNVYTPYLNGAQLGNGFTQAMNYWSGTGNGLYLGAAGVVGTGVGSYVYYGKNTISNMRMYNRALSAQEIKQNFNALRGRFGI